MPRSFHFLHGCAAVGIALVGSMLRDAYTRALDVCELFSQFDFWPTFQDEILLHHTWLPLVNVPISTVAVVAALLLGFAATYFRLIELLWLFLIDFFSGRWLYNLFFVHIPAWLPFLASDPGVPDLLSDPEDADAFGGDGMAANPIACAAAMAKLVEVKLKHENCTIERPDDWLVFDPEEDKLVPKKDLEARQLRRKLGSRSSTESSSSSSTTVSAASSPTRKLQSPENGDDAENTTEASGAAQDDDEHDEQAAASEQPESLVHRKR